MGSLNILGIEGPKGAGKDTAFKLINGMCPFNVRRFAFADELKNELIKELKLSPEILRGTTEEKDNTYTKYEWSDPRFSWHRKGREGFITYREMMQLWGFKAGTPYWINKLFTKINAYANEYPEDIAIITDVRFPEEVGAIIEAGGSLVLIDGVKTKKHNDDYSEAGGLYYDYKVPGRGKAPLSKTKAELADIMWSAFGINCRG